MTKEKILVSSYVLFLVTLLSCGMYIQYLRHVPPKVITKYKTVTKTIEVQPKGVLLSVVLKDLQKDLQTNYSFLSQNQQQEILSAIIESSNRFKINPLVVYSLISVESSFRFYIRSPERIVVGSDGKKHKDRAIGLTSIVYSIWNKPLKENNIISTKTELYQIKPNILAGTFILSVLKKRYKSDIDKALKAYFGLNSKYASTYLRKIKNKFGSLAYNKIEE